MPLHERTKDRTQNNFAVNPRPHGRGLGRGSTKPGSYFACDPKQLIRVPSEHRPHCGPIGRARRVASRFVASLTGLACLLTICGCVGKSENEVIVYCALDKEFAAPVFQQFEKETGITVRAKYDQESNKTVGLANAILEQGDSPVCQAFWNNEILHTLRLQNAGRLSPLQSARLGSFPESFVDRDRQWCGFAACARILIVNTNLLPDEASRPTRVADLAAAKWQGRCAMARPLFGTTATHAAVLFDRLGEDQALEFFKAVKQNAVIEGGNKQVARRVAQGELAFGLTDTDDAFGEVEQGMPVTIVFPDQGADESGTLFIPNTVAKIKGSKPSPTVDRLIDFILSAPVEQKLAAGDSAQIPLSKELRGSPHRLPIEGKRMMDVDFAKAAEHWDERAKKLEAIFGF